MRALWSQTQETQVFFKTFFDFSILDIFKNVHFRKPPDFYFEICLETQFLIFRQNIFLLIMMFTQKN
jgi:hypothetical protein